MKKIYLLPFGAQKEWKEPWNEHLRTSCLISIQVLSSVLSLQRHFFLVLLPHFLLPLPCCNSVGPWAVWKAPSRWKQEAESCTHLKVEKWMGMAISTALSSYAQHIHRAHSHYICLGVGGGGGLGTDPTGNDRGVFKVVINWHREFLFKET